MDKKFRLQLEKKVQAFISMIYTGKPVLRGHLLDKEKLVF
jgi:hypothetical protein